MSYELLRKAIEARQSLTGVYDDYVRFFSPHILGKNAAGEPIVVCFQYGGGRPDGWLPKGGDWCLFEVRRLRRLEANCDEWIAGPLETKPAHLLIQIDMGS